MNDCIIIVPVYQEKLQDYEIMAFDNLLHLYGNRYDICLIYSETYNLDNLYKYDFLKPYFDNNIFHLFYLYGDAMRSVEDYNLHVCLNYKFYEFFENNYKYMLIHQLDAFIFKDELQYWIDKGFDYIGGLDIPSYHPYKDYFYSCNGGFSLRNISVFKNILVKNFGNIQYDWTPSEDVYFSQYVKNKPKPSEVMRFAFNQCPYQYYIISDMQLPFGAHWIHKDQWLLNQCEEVYNKRINIV